MNDEKKFAYIAKEKELACIVVGDYPIGDDIETEKADTVLGPIVEHINTAFSSAVAERVEEAMSGQDGNYHHWSKCREWRNDLRELVSWMRASLLGLEAGGGLQGVPAHVSDILREFMKREAAIRERGKA